MALALDFGLWRTALKSRAGFSSCAHPTRQSYDPLSITRVEFRSDEENACFLGLGFLGASERHAYRRGTFSSSCIAGLEQVSERGAPRFYDVNSKCARAQTMQQCTSSTTTRCVSGLQSELRERAME